MTTSDNQIERAESILDAAETLIVRYGYDKTTVSDIAREAGISKGAIYLSFESKEALFEALLRREIATHTARWIELVEADPRGGTIGAMYRNTLRALDERPFMAAMFRQDRTVMGTYLKKKDNIFSDGSEMNARHEFVKRMQAAGVIRGDVDARVIAHIMNMLAYSLVAIGDVIPEQNIPPTEDVLEGIAVMMDAAFTPEESDGEAGKEVVRQIVSAYNDHLAGSRTGDVKEEEKS